MSSDTERERQWRVNVCFYSFSCSLLMLLANSSAEDTISVNQVIRDGDTILSAGGMYELGFFSPGKSKNRYLGIWYKKISFCTVVWVANREKPLRDTSGVFKVNNEGILLLLDGGGTMLWSSNSFVSLRKMNPVAQLLDNGNLVVRNESSNDQVNFVWESFDYPTDTILPGMKLGKDLVSGMERKLTSWKSPDDPSPGLHVTWIDTNGYPQVFQRRGSVLQLRIGPWSGLRFRGLPPEKPNPIFSSQFVVNDREIYFKYELVGSVVQRIHLNWVGNSEQLIWVERIQEWVVYATAEVDSCGRYALCGPHGSCSINKYPPCSCMEGFEPRHPEAWDTADWSGGCQRKEPLDCGDGDGFQRISGVKFPDTQHSWYNQSLSLGECEMTCKRKCNCTAYANLDVRRGGSGCLLWFNELMDVQEYDENQALYIRRAISELPGHTFVHSGSKKKKTIDADVLSISSVPLVLLVLAVVVNVRRKKSQRSHMKGHDETRSFMLDWPRRFSIIQGIARGLLYLHQDSRLRIIHRDMKASNVLLDDDMTPKISDFGLARRFAGYDDPAETKKVVGTYGYMSPEYAVHGRFSVKSDVFSFGVLVLEIVSGKRNREFTSESYTGNLLGHAWRLYKEDKSLDLMSGCLRGSCIASQVLRSVHVGLLCVQNLAQDRPTMPSVVLMLGGEGMLPPPKQPTFFNQESLHEAESVGSVDEATITILHAR